MSLSEFEDWFDSDLVFGRPSFLRASGTRDPVRTFPVTVSLDGKVDALRGASVRLPYGASERSTHMAYTDVGDIQTGDVSKATSGPYSGYYWLVEFVDRTHDDHLEIALSFSPEEQKKGTDGASDAL